MVTASYYRLVVRVVLYLLHRLLGIGARRGQREREREQEDQDQDQEEALWVCDRLVLRH
jgi:hypothetical protein